MPSFMSLSTKYRYESVLSVKISGNIFGNSLFKTWRTGLRNIGIRQNKKANGLTNKLNASEQRRHQWVSQYLCQNFRQKSIVGWSLGAGQQNRMTFPHSLWENPSLLFSPTSLPEPHLLCCYPIKASQPFVIISKNAIPLTLLCGYEFMTQFCTKLLFFNLWFCNKHELTCFDRKWSEWRL